MTSEFDLEFNSTSHQRLYTDQNDRVEALITAAGVEVVETYGGTMLGLGPDALASDNGFTVRTDENTAQRLAEQIEALVGQPVTVTPAPGQ